MKLALACFVRNGGNPDKSPILSPIYAKSDLLAQLPPMRIFVAEIDSLRDHSLVFMDRYLQAKGITAETANNERAQMRLYLCRDYMHGFCNLDTNHVGVEEYSKATRATCAQFRELFMLVSS